MLRLLDGCGNVIYFLKAIYYHWFINHAEFSIMDFIYYIISGILVIASILPLIPSQHRIFRVFDFGKIQILVLLLLVFSLAFFLVENKTLPWSFVQFVLAGFIIYDVFLLIPYFPFFPRDTQKIPPKHSPGVSILSINVYQFNQEYQRLIDLIKDLQPDLVLTMESSQDWENALSVLENDYPFHIKVARENTYGMHFYSQLPIGKSHVHYFVADDIPSIEAEIFISNHVKFTLFGVHPPPPSPTEEETTKERDGEILSVARRVRQINDPVIVVGDFNNVAWSRSAKLFKKTSELIDPRIGRGFYSTFHAKYKLIRFPIDLFYHSADVFIEEFKTLGNIGSDHLPLYCQFFINKRSESQFGEVEVLEDGEYEEVEELIKRGIEEESDCR